MNAISSSFVASKINSAGNTIALLDVCGTSRTRKWGIWRMARVVRIDAGAVYKNVRSPGVHIVFEREYDARSVNKTEQAHAAARACFDKIEAAQIA